MGRSETEYKIGVKDIPLLIHLTARYTVNNLRKGCEDFTRQKDLGTGKVLDLCRANETDCLFYDGYYMTHGQTIPTSDVQDPECENPLEPYTEVGFCRHQKDMVRIGPIRFFDKKWIRPTPK